MIKGLFLASIAVVMMTACSVDEGYDTPVAPNEITFSVTPVNASRQISAAADNDVKNFIISARNNGTPLLTKSLSPFQEADGSIPESPISGLRKATWISLPTDTIRQQIANAPHCLM